MPAKCALLLGALLLVTHPASPPQRPARDRTPAEAKEQDAAPAAHELYESGRIQLSAPPPTVVAAGVQCDANGNPYLIYTTSLQILSSLPHASQDLPVSKLSLRSKSFVGFPVGQFGDYAEYSRPSFYVDPRGKVYGLVVGYRHERGYKGPDWPESLIVKYEDDGTLDSVVSLQPLRGKHFQAWNFAVFLDGNFIVTGTVLSDMHVPTEVLTGVFDRGGGFLGPVALPHDVGPEQATPQVGAEAPGGAPKEGATGRPNQRRKDEGIPGAWISDVTHGTAVGSLDGSVYLIRVSDPVRLYAVSSAGIVTREMEVEAPVAGGRIYQASLAGEGRLLLEFLRPPTPEHPDPTHHLALLDLNTGKITDSYHLPAGVSRIFACATPQNEFLFLGTSKDNQLEVVKYAAR